MKNLWVNNLPTAGVVCLFRTILVMPNKEEVKAKWAKCAIEFINDFGVVVKAVDGKKANTCYFFDKLDYVLEFKLLEEQTTAKENAIDEIDDILFKAMDEDQPMSNALYDAGYHKGPKVGKKVLAADLSKQYLKQDDFGYEAFVNSTYVIYKKD